MPQLDTVKNQIVEVYVPDGISQTDTPALRGELVLIHFHSCFSRLLIKSDKD